MSDRRSNEELHDKSVAQLLATISLHANRRGERAARELARRLEAAEEALWAIQANAEAWHGPIVSGNRQAAALAVIAKWARDPDEIPEAVRDAARRAAEGDTP